MQDNMMDAFNAQTKQMFEPMRKINSLMLNNMEKMTQYQLEAMKRYSQMGTERIRSATEIQDAESLRDFGTKQAEMMNELSQQMQEDARVMSEMSSVKPGSKCPTKPRLLRKGSSLRKPPVTHRAKAE